MFNVWLFPMFICILPPCSSFLFVQSVIIWSASFDAVHPMLCAASVNFFFVSGAILIVSTSVFFIVLPLLVYNVHCKGLTNHVYLVYDVYVPRKKCLDFCVLWKGVSVYGSWYFRR